MLPEADILQHLGKRLMELYCPNCHLTHLTKSDCFHHLIFAIHDYWHLDFALLPGDETFYHTLHAHYCGSAMKEKLAIFYFAITDAPCRSHMPRLYLDIAKKQRLSDTPYWNRFTEEYNLEHKPNSVKAAALHALLESFKTMPRKDLEKVVEEGRRLLGERGEWKGLN